jgi:methylated-DNA-[protein]-cysteine S-methyltransferase
VSVLYTTLASPIGELLVLGDGHTLAGLHMQDGPRPISVRPQWRLDGDAFARVARQLDEYFAGERLTFEVDLAPVGTAFQHTVWEALSRVGYGETISYGELARRLGRPSAVRGVGLANARNPLSIIVPCHRVIGSDGSLTGYGGGIERKRLLLGLESRAGAI